MPIIIRYTVVMELTPEQVASLKSYMPPVGKSWFFCFCGATLEADIEEIEKEKEEHFKECTNYQRILKERRL